MAKFIAEPSFKDLINIKEYVGKSEWVAVLPEKNKSFPVDLFFFGWNSERVYYVYSVTTGNQNVIRKLNGSILQNALFFKVGTGHKIRYALEIDFGPQLTEEMKSNIVARKDVKVIIDFYNRKRPTYERGGITYTEVG